MTTRINLYLRYAQDIRGHKIGTVSCADDAADVAAQVAEHGVGGEVESVSYQFVADSRGAGIEIIYDLEPSS